MYCYNLLSTINFIIFLFSTRLNIYLAITLPWHSSKQNVRNCLRSSFEPEQNPAQFRGVILTPKPRWHYCFFFVNLILKRLPWNVWRQSQPHPRLGDYVIAKTKKTRNECRHCLVLGCSPTATLAPWHPDHQQQLMETDGVFVCVCCVARIPHSKCVFAEVCMCGWRDGVHFGGSAWETWWCDIPVLNWVEQRDRKVETIWKQRDVLEIVYRICCCFVSLFGDQMYMECNLYAVLVAL